MEALKFGKGVWATKTGSSMAYNDQNDNYKPLPFNVERDSIATRVNKEGLIEVVGHDKLRIDYTDTDKGVALLEPSRTNLIPSNVSDWVVFQSNVTQSNQSPDGYNNAIKITSNAVVNSGVYLSGLSATGNTEIFTIWLKGEDGGEILEIGDSTNRTTVTLTNEWVRYEAKTTSASSAKILYNQAINPIVQTWYAWGPQLEDNVSYPTSYIPTSGSAVTRAADVANNAGNSEVFSDSQGVLFANIAALDNDLTNRTIGILGDSSNLIELAYRNTTNQIRALIKSSNVVAVNLQYSLSDITLYNKIVIKYKSNDCSLWVNGFEVLTDTSASMPSGLIELNFNRFDGAEDFYGKTKEISYYDATLTDSELEYLTSYRSLSELVKELNLNTL